MNKVSNISEDLKLQKSADIYFHKGGRKEAKHLT